MEETRHSDYIGSKIGMWLFLFTEAFLFFGPLLLYAVFRYKYPEGFAAASAELNLAAGAVNTVVLLSSSLTMAASITALQRGHRKVSLYFLATTIALGFLFLVNKYFEWSDKFAHGIYPTSPKLLEMPGGESVFFGLYYFATGMHGLHVLIGICVLAVVAFWVYSGKVHRGDFIKLENSGLYWHLVDVVWIYLFPFFYLTF